MTQSHDRDYELSLAALRGEDPPGVDKARLKEKLVKRGVALAASATAAPASAAAATSTFTLATKLTAAAIVASSLVVAWQLGSTPRAEPRLSESESHVMLARPSQTMSLLPAEREANPARTQVDTAPRRRERTGVTANAQGARTPARDLGLDLARENALLSQAAAALKVSDAAAARRWLDQHEREFPQGFLRAEREKARRRVEELRGP